MSHNSFGHLFRVTTFGESHGVALGAVTGGLIGSAVTNVPGDPAGLIIGGVLGAIAGGAIASC